MAPEVLLMSLRAWESLSADDQIMFQQVARASSAHMRQLWSGLEQQSREQARTAGNMVVDVDKKPFAEAMLPLYAKAPVGDQQPLIERIRQIQ